jgi:hypothetical protein
LQLSYKIFSKGCETMDRKLLCINIATKVTDKKRDPNYSMLRGLIPNELLKKFKIYCVDNKLDNSQALENILREYFESKGI